MRVNLVIQPGDVCEVQLPEGDTLITGGPEVAHLFRNYRPLGPMTASAGWRVAEYEIDPFKATGALGTALQQEAARARTGAT